MQRSGSFEVFYLVSAVYNEQLAVHWWCNFCLNWLSRTCKLNLDTLWSSSKTTQHWWTLTKQFYFAGFLVMLVSKVTNKRKTKTALHSSISAVKYPPSDLYHDVTSLCYKNSGKLTGISIKAINFIRLNLTVDTISEQFKSMRRRCSAKIAYWSYLTFSLVSSLVRRSASLLFMWLCPYHRLFTHWMSSLHYCTRKIFFCFVYGRYSHN